LSAECATVGFYRARKPQETPLDCLVEALYDKVKGVWEEHFEQRYGFWRVFVDDVVNAYLDCGRFESGFARVRCSDCGDEFLVAFIDNDVAERIFRRKVISFLTGERLLSDERAHVVLGWNHNSGFSVDDSVRFEPLTPGQPRVRDDDGLTDLERRARRRAWARLIRRIYEVDPLVCTSCGCEMRIVSVILEHRVITRIFRSLARKGIKPGRGPPERWRSPLPKTA